MGYLILAELPSDLPTNWKDTDYVSPNGTEVGKPEKYGYNYLMRQVNLSQKAINDLDKAICNLIYNEGSNIITDATYDDRSLSDYIRRLIENDDTHDVLHIVAKMQNFQDLPQYGKVYVINAYNNESSLWDVTATEASTNRIYVRQLDTNTGWLTSGWDEILHTGSYQRLTGLAPASLE